MMRNTIILCFTIFIGISVGCGPLPKPFKQNHTIKENSLIQPKEENDITVRLINSGPNFPRNLLIRAVASEITQFDLIAYAEERRKSRFVLFGEMEGWRGGKVGSPPFRMHWILKDREETVIEEFKFNVFGTASEWYGNPQKLIGKIAKHVAKKIAARIGSQSLDLISPKKIWVENIRKGTKENDMDLQLSIKFFLRSLGVEVASKRENANQFLFGNVSVSNSNKKQSKVIVVWVLKDINGVEVGSARQSNSLPSIAIQNNWELIVHKISAAAAEAVKKISGRTQIK